ncbi:hypothetical protein [Marinitoga sp. 38H-ov]|uniref:hypothetical protein n=1 Tax=Marinitoga sp. 38H-ov TaxID=1755814 RepID=UPI0013EB4212|nr:hypothetical protein [Marinitoga sp. 38H-ov]KAF2956208.1 hypothetical protein AS160_06945 [Marinitoga sp. 38H-ov]
MGVQKLFILIFLIINIFVLGYKIHVYPYDFDLNYPLDFEVLIIEADTLFEYNLLTNQPYSKAAIFIPEENIIISQPFYVLKKLNIFRKTIIHELYHYYLTNFLNMNYKYQDIYIKKLGF